MGIDRADVTKKAFSDMGKGHHPGMNMMLNIFNDHHHHDCHYYCYIVVITFMQGIYNYIPETSHVSMVYSVAVVLYM
jgi:hypothetical protein